MSDFTKQAIAQVRFMNHERVNKIFVWTQKNLEIYDSGGFNSLLNSAFYEAGFKANMGELD